MAGKFFLQFLERPMRAHFYRADAAFEDAGDFLVLQILKAAENQNFAGHQRQCGEGLLQQRDLLGLAQCVIGRQSGADEGFASVYAVGLQGGFHSPLAPGIIKGVSADSVHPGGEPVSRLEGMAVFQHAQKDIVDQVLAELNIVR